MVVIRLARGGSKKRPFYHIVVANSRSPRDGRRIEVLGFFNPVARGKEEIIRLDTQRLEHWLSVGAQTTDRVKKIIKDHKEGKVGGAGSQESESAEQAA